MKFLAVKTKKTINTLVNMYAAKADWKYITGGTGKASSGTQDLMDFDAVESVREAIEKKKRRQ